jgi:hypothetical protein
MIVWCRPLQKGEFVASFLQKTQSGGKKNGASTYELPTRFDTSGAL